MCAVKILEEEEARKQILKVINEICTDLEVSYLDISDVLNVDSAYVFRLLKGKKKLTLSALIKITNSLLILNAQKGNPIDAEELRLSSILRKAGV